MAKPQQKVLITLPKNLTPTQREAAAAKIINRIKERTNQGFDKNGNRFQRYAASYVNDKDFKLAGKSKGDVNLNFTGEMMNEIELLTHGSGFITIGYQKGDVNDKVAFNKEKGREFLGITEKEKNKILSDLPSDDKSPEIEQIIEVPSLTKRILDRLRGN